MSDIKQNIAAYERQRLALEDKHVGKWVLFHDEQLVDVFDDFQAAAALAVERFGRGPYLIRRVGAPPMTLPASVMYRPVYA